MPIMAAIAACDLTMPRTPYRATISPADTVGRWKPWRRYTSISLPCSVSSNEGGCVIGGWSMFLSSSADVLIGVERALELDREGQLRASMLPSRKGK
jgi:thymidine phosphorylase